MNPGVLNPLFGNQDYLDPAPDGIDVTPAWAMVDGSGVGFGDVEKDWLLGHEDLAGLTPFLPHTSPGLVGSASTRRGAGSGARPADRARHRRDRAGRYFAGVVDADHRRGGQRRGGDHRSRAALSAGDVLLIEVQLEPDKRPAELENLTFTGDPARGGARHRRRRSRRQRLARSTRLSQRSTANTRRSRTRVRFSSAAEPARSGFRMDAPAARTLAIESTATRGARTSQRPPRPFIRTAVSSPALEPLPSPRRPRRSDTRSPSAVRAPPRRSSRGPRCSCRTSTSNRR